MYQINTCGPVLLSFTSISMHRAKHEGVSARQPS